MVSGTIAKFNKYAEALNMEDKSNSNDKTAKDNTSGTAREVKRGKQESSGTYEGEKFKSSTPDKAKFNDYE